MPPKILHENTRNKTQNKKGNSFHQKQKIRRSDFLIKLEETQQFSKPNKNKKKIAARKMFPSPTQVQPKSLK